MNAGDAYDVRSRLHLAIMLRLKRGQTLDEATEALRARQPQIFAAAFPDEPSTPESTAYRDDPFALVSTATPGSHDLRREYEGPLAALLAIVAAVLLIACANLANLLLARAAARRHELSVRTALGATRWRLARQRLLESLVLVSLGGAAGLFLAAVGSRTLVAQLSTLGNPVALDLPLDWRVLAFTATITVVTVVLFDAVLLGTPSGDAGPDGWRGDVWARECDRENVRVRHAGPARGDAGLAGHVSPERWR